MTRVLAVASQKGGVGKTSLTQNLGAELARAGRKVLLVDFDPQSNLTSGWGLDPTAADQPLHTEIRQLWDELDDEQRRLVLDTMRMLAKASTPHIIGGEEDKDKK